MHNEAFGWLGPGPWRPGWNHGEPGGSRNLGRQKGRQSKQTDMDDQQSNAEGSHSGRCYYCSSIACAGCQCSVSHLSAASSLSPARCAARVSVSVFSAETALEPRIDRPNSANPTNHNSRARRLVFALILIRHRTTATSVRLYYMWLSLGLRRVSAASLTARKSLDMACRRISVP